MGLRVRKTVKLGPFRWTISKSGISGSVGVKGYRVTKLANGKTMRTTSIPGTGISHVSVEKPKPKKKKKFLGLFTLALIVCMIFAGCSSGEKEKEPPADPPAATEAATTRDDVAVVSDPKSEPEASVPETSAQEPEASVLETSAQEPEASAPVASAQEPEANPQPASDLPEPEPTPEPEPEPEPAPAPAPAPAPDPEPEQPAAAEPVGPAVIGNKNSEVYHELSCDSVKKMKDKNKVNFDSADAAEAKGFRPCQNCH